MKCYRIGIAHFLFFISYVTLSEQAFCVFLLANRNVFQMCERSGELHSCEPFALSGEYSVSIIVSLSL